VKIRALEDVLFAEWRRNRPGFVADGAVDETAYLASSPRLLFVLKEVNDPHGGDWDLREFLLDGGRAQTWNNVTRWIDGIRSLPDDIPWNAVAEITDGRRQRTLRSIVAMNLKKSPGGHTTDPAALSNAAAADAALINRQFALYEPDLVICCGADTSNIFDGLVDLGGEPRWKATRRGIRYREFQERRFVVSFAHPEARVGDCLLYYGLVDAIREIRFPESGTRME
jgi:hypothetical protein